jgi:hypothetical protein
MVSAMAKEAKNMGIKNTGQKVMKVANVAVMESFEKRLRQSKEAKAKAVAKLIAKRE